MCDRTARPALCRWWDALEAREAYRGTQSDFHTHVHDLPPQMGGCYPKNGSPAQRRERGGRRASMQGRGRAFPTPR